MIALAYGKHSVLQNGKGLAPKAKLVASYEILKDSDYPHINMYV